MSDLKSALLARERGHSSREPPRCHRDQQLTGLSVSVQRLFSVREASSGSVSNQAITFIQNCEDNCLILTSHGVALFLGAGNQTVSLLNYSRERAIKVFIRNHSVFYLATEPPCPSLSIYTYPLASLAAGSVTREQIQIPSLFLRSLQQVDPVYANIVVESSAAYEVWSLSLEKCQHTGMASGSCWYARDTVVEARQLGSNTEVTIHTLSADSRSSVQMQGTGAIRHAEVFGTSLILLHNQGAVQVVDLRVASSRLLQQRPALTMLSTQLCADSVVFFVDGTAQFMSQADSFKLEMTDFLFADNREVLALLSQNRLSLLRPGEDVSTVDLSLPAKATSIRFSEDQAALYIGLKNGEVFVLFY